MDAAEVVVEAAVVVVEVVEAAVIVTDPVRIAAMTAAKTVEIVEIVETAGIVVLVPTVAQEDLEEEEAEAVEARKNSAWTRRLSPPWDKPEEVNSNCYINVTLHESN